MGNTIAQCTPGMCSAQTDDAHARLEDRMDDMSKQLDMLVRAQAAPMVRMAGTAVPAAEVPVTPQPIRVEEPAPPAVPVVPERVQVENPAPPAVPERVEPAPVGRVE